MNNQVDKLSNAIKKNGHRLTQARKAILQALAYSGGHVSADDLVDIVHQDTPGVGRMTVYRTLDLLLELGLIRPIYQGTGAAHYVIMDEGHHHHLICSQCDRVFEFDDCAVQDLMKAIADRFDFEIQGHLLEFYGLCPNCHARG
ncbi:MAG TPA: Fur family transcriptional regulator [Candidatus Sulfomarinibacteraceae bacterium]|nr:Fur family transcriptional regulator [Candidatus Sulfomarinibacteraceae bacterium]